jgi:hypothetical protein
VADEQQFEYHLRTHLYKVLDHNSPGATFSKCQHQAVETRFELNETFSKMQQHDC